MIKINMINLCFNSKAEHDYHIETTFNAGIVLLASEVKSLINREASLNGSWIAIEDGEVYLYDSYIAQYKVTAKHTPHEEKRKRKLLLTKKEIRNLNTEVTKYGSSIVPIEFWINVADRKAKIKLEFGIGKGKKNYDKRESEKKKTIEKELKRLK